MALLAFQVSMSYYSDRLSFIYDFWGFYSLATSILFLCAIYLVFSLCYAMGSSFSVAVLCVSCIYMGVSFLRRDFLL